MNRKLVFWRIVILFFSSLALFSFFSAWPLLSINFEEMIHDTKLHFTEERSGYILSVGTAFYLIGKFVNGWISGVIGGRWSVLVYQFIIVISSIAFGFTYHFSLFVILWGCLKFGQSAAYVSATHFVSPWFPASQHGLIFGIFSAACSLGDFAPRLVLGALSHTFNILTWRHSFFIIGGLIAIFGVLTFCFLRDSPLNLMLQVEESDETEEVHPLNEKSTLEAIWYFCKSPSVYLLLIAQTSMTIVFTYSEEYVPLYFSQVYKLSPSVSSMVSSIIIGGSIISVIMGGFLYDRLSKRFQSIFMITCFMLASICITGLALFSHTIPFQVALLLFSLMYVFLVTPFYLVQGLFAVSYGGIHCGILLGITDGGSYLGAIFFSFFGGLIIKNLGWNYFLGCFGVIAWLGTIALLIFYIMPNVEMNITKSN